MSVLRRSMALVGLVLACASANAATAAPAPSASPGVSLQLGDIITAASKRFGVPAAWIQALIHVESSGTTGAVSQAGARGLMQLMPSTYAELRDKLSLGTDPFDPYNNVMAGAAYVRQLMDTFGAPGFLAAYNAGPGRYHQHVARGRPLPRETRAYVAKLSPAIAAVAAPTPMSLAATSSAPVPVPLLVPPPAMQMAAAVTKPQTPSALASADLAPPY